MSGIGIGERGGVSPHLSEELCLALALGVVSDAEFETAMRHCRDCPACEARFRRHAADREALRVRFARGERARSARVGPALRVWAPVMAAAAVLLVVFMIRSTTPPRVETSGRWIGIEHELVSARSAEPGADSLLWRGLDAYGRHDARAAVRLLSASRPVAGSGHLRGVYLASALVWTRRPAEALSELDRIAPETLPEPWRSEALWVRFLALEQVGRRSEADAQLRRLANAPGEVGSLARRRIE